MTSIISFFVLLLITYSYSVPVGKIYDSSTVNYNFTTTQIMIDHENTSDIPPMHGVQSNGTSNIHKKRTDSVDSPLKRTIEESHADEELLHVQDIDRRRESSVQERSTDDEETLRAKEVDRRGEPSLEERSNDDEETLRAKEVDRRGEPSLKERSNDDEETLRTKEVDRRGEPSLKERSTEDEESLRVEKFDRRRDPPIPSGRPIDEPDSDDVTTTDVSRPSRIFEESSSPSTIITSTLNYSSSHEEHDKRSIKDELSAKAIESSDEFERRAIRPIMKETSNESQDEIQLLTRNLSGNNMEMTTNIMSSSEPSSSMDSFGKMTGLLHDPSNEVSTTTIQSSFAIRHVQQLSQDQK